MSADPLYDFTPEFGDPTAPWFRSFAWRPVWTVDRGRVWLRPVWKRQIQKHSYLSPGGPDFWFQYAVMKGL